MLDDIKQTKIIIDSKDQLFELITSGYRFEKLLRLFKKMGYQDRLTVQRKASIDVSHFKNAISNQEKSIF